MLLFGLDRWETTASLKKSAGGAAMAYGGNLFVRSVISRMDRKAIAGDAFGMRKSSILVLPILLVATSLDAYPRGLRHYDDLGKTEVWDNLKQDIVPIASSEPYSQLRICAFRKHVRLFGGSIRFTDGSEQALPADIVIPASGCLRRLMLSGQRPIESVRMVYWAEIFGPMDAEVKVYLR